MWMPSSYIHTWVSGHNELTAALCIGIFGVSWYILNLLTAAKEGVFSVQHPWKNVSFQCQGTCMASAHVWYSVPEQIYILEFLI